jgi:hypothetical protein
MLCSHDYIVGIMTGYMLDDLRLESWQRQEIFLFSKTSGHAQGPIQPPIQWMQGILSPGLKQSGHEADHLPPFSAVFKNKWSHMFILFCVFMAYT